jgi:hypothetical protein
MTGCKQQVRGRLAVLSPLTDGSIAPEVAFVKARRNWPNLWMATTRDWLSMDDRIKELARSVREGSASVRMSSFNSPRGQAGRQHDQPVTADG